MARVLQTSTDNTRRWCRVAALCAFCAVLFAVPGCIIPPELPRDPNDPVPPFFGEVDPADRVVPIAANTDSQSFSATVFDANPHERMYYALVNSQRGTTALGSVAALPPDPEDEDEFPDLTKYSISPENNIGLQFEKSELCAGAPEGGVETFTLWVADREIASASASDPEPPELVPFEGDDERPGPFLISRSWIFEYQTDACN